VVVSLPSFNHKYSPITKKNFQEVPLYTLMTTPLFLSLNSGHLYLLKPIKIYGAPRMSSTSHDALSEIRIMKLLFGTAKIFYFRYVIHSPSSTSSLKFTSLLFSSTADGGIQPKCYGDMASCHPNERIHCMKNYQLLILCNSFQNSVQSIIKRFSTFYTSDSPSWGSLSDLASALNWTAIINSTTEEYLETQGVSQKYIGEVVEAATRVNYGQVRKLNFSMSMLSEYLVCRMLIISMHWRERPLWPLQVLPV